MLIEGGCRNRGWMAIRRRRRRSVALSSPAAAAAANGKFSFFLSLTASFRHLRCGGSVAKWSTLSEAWPSQNYLKVVSHTIQEQEMQNGLPVKLILHDLSNLFSRIFAPAHCKRGQLPASFHGSGIACHFRKNASCTSRERGSSPGALN